MNDARAHSTASRLALAAMTTLFAAASTARGGSALEVASFTLIDADTDTPIAGFDPIPDGAFINLGVLPSANLNIRANTNPPTVGSVRFSFQAVTNFHTENGAPYALFGDAGGDYVPWTPTEGSYAVEATAYSMSNGEGDASPTHQVGLTVLNYALSIDAGPDLSFATVPSSITLSGSVEPANTEIAAMGWTQLAGPLLNPSAGSQLPAIVSGLSEGVYVFRVYVVDTLGSVAEDYLTITIGAPSYAWQITGELKQWHPITLTFDGPFVSETGTPNPFTDYRMIVAFIQGGDVHLVPGYFAADGNAAETGATAGNKWRVHFTPPATGAWSFYASFWQGADIAASDDPPIDATPAAFDGTTGAFSIGPSDKTGRDFRGQGMLEYVGEHYLRFGGTGRYYLKGGADSPENFLAYVGFDDTVGTHAYAPHVGDWQPGDPSWRGDQGRGIIGALNYLAGMGMNSVYFMTMNVGGDGNDVWPWVSPTQRLRYDCSRLDQWDIVFSHMDRIGLALHVVTQETENDQLLDGGELGIERRIYYRELMARFGHHLAVMWNLGEENTNTDAQRAEFAHYFAQHDPYDHPVSIHTAPGAKEVVYAPLLGNADFEGPSLQIANNNVVSEWVDRSAEAGRPWVVCYDEQAPALAGVVPDANDYWHDSIRKPVLWGTLMGGGAGVEYYFGYEYPHNDLNCEDWRSRDHMWELTRIALEFFHSYVPFWNMRHANELVSAGGALCLADDGATYLVYLPNGQATSLNLESYPGEFSVLWFNPRVGGGLLQGDTQTISGPGLTPIGLPPPNSPGDWVALIRIDSCGSEGDINDDGRVDGRDIAQFISCVGGGGAPGDCVGADVDQNAVIDADDAAALAAALLCGP